MSGPGIQIAEAKAPWVMFETKAVEDRAASIEQGRHVTRDVDYVKITPHGSRDQIVIVATEWLDNMDKEAKVGRLPEEWARKYRAAFNSWKEGKAIPVEGTPVANWPVISPAQVDLLQNLKILTVESLAAANEEVIRRLGMGGRALVDKAKDFLKAASGPGKLSQEMEALRQRLLAAETNLKTLEARNKELQAMNANLRGGATASHPDSGDDIDSIIK